MRLQLEYCVQSSAPQYKRAVEILETIQSPVKRRAAKVMKGLEQFTYEESLR